MHLQHAASQSLHEHLTRTVMLLNANLVREITPTTNNLERIYEKNEKPTNYQDR